MPGVEAVHSAIGMGQVLTLWRSALQTGYWGFEAPLLYSFSAILAILPLVSVSHMTMSPSLVKISKSDWLPRCFLSPGFPALPTHTPCGPYCHPMPQRLLSVRGAQHWDMEHQAGVRGIGKGTLILSGKEGGHMSLRGAHRGHTTQP